MVLSKIKYCRLHNKVIYKMGRRLGERDGGGAGGGRVLKCVCVCVWGGGGGGSGSRRVGGRVQKWEGKRQSWVEGQKMGGSESGRVSGQVWSRRVSGRGATLRG